MYHTYKLYILKVFRYFPFLSRTKNILPFESYNFISISTIKNKSDNKIIPHNEATISINIFVIE